MPVSMWGGNSPASYQSGDGTWFTSVSVPGSARFAVFREFPNGSVFEVDLGDTFEGQGQLCLQWDGRLFAVFGENAGNSPVRRVEIPEWVNPRGNKTAAMLALWRGRNYVGTDTDTPEEIALRLDRLRVVLVEIVDRLWK